MTPGVSAGGEVSYHHWYCPAPAELNSQGGAGPPVSPEVIVILLILRRYRLTDALSVHVSARELCNGREFPVLRVQLLRS